MTLTCKGPFAILDGCYTTHTGSVRRKFHCIFQCEQKCTFLFSARSWVHTQFPTATNWQQEVRLTGQKFSYSFTNSYTFWYIANNEAYEHLWHLCGNPILCLCTKYGSHVGFLKTNKLSLIHNVAQQAFWVMYLKRHEARRGAWASNLPSSAYMKLRLACDDADK